MCYLAPGHVPLTAARHPGQVLRPRLESHHRRWPCTCIIVSVSLRLSIRVLKIKQRAMEVTPPPMSKVVPEGEPDAMSHPMVQRLFHNAVRLG